MIDAYLYITMALLFLWAAMYICCLVVFFDIGGMKSAHMLLWMTVVPVALVIWPVGIPVILVLMFIYLRRYITRGKPPTVV